MQVRAALSRADLLRALRQAGADADAAVRYAHCCGFVAAAEPAAISVAGPQVGQVAALHSSTAFGTAAAAAPDAAARPPLRARHFGVVAVTATAAPQQPAPAAAAPLTDADCGPRPYARPVPMPLLVRPARLWPALRASVAQVRPAGIDTGRLTHILARAQPIRSLPRSLSQAWPGQLWVVWDRADRLQPYAQDFRSIIDSLLRLRGTAGLVLWTVRDLPSQVLQREDSRGVKPHHGAVPLPPPGTVLLLLSDLGALAHQPQAESAWRQAAQQWARAGARTVAWTPLAPRQLPAAVAACLPVHGLRPSGSLRAMPGHGRQPAQRQAEQARLAALRDDLLVLASCAVILDPPLLRALRLLHPALRREPALEALCWSAQPLVGSSLLSRPLAPQQAPVYRARLKDRPLALQLAVFHTLAEHHASTGRFTGAEECLLWQAHASPAAARGAVAAACAEASTLFVRLAQLEADGEAASAAAQYARDLLTRHGRDQQWLRAHSGLLAPVQVLSRLADVPAGLDPAEVLRLRQAARPAALRSVQLVQRGPALWLWPAEQVLPAGASPVSAPFIAGDVVVQPGQPPDAVADWHSYFFGRHEFEPLGPARIVQSTKAPLCLLPRMQSGRIVTGAATYSLAELERPPWVHEWARDRYGLCGDLIIEGITQRLRWIPPGHFLMGSTDAERARIADKVYRQWAQREAPQHSVHISQGFWLADGACTQALWQAVMGDNPSHHQGDLQRPVEQVSWDDVQHFLQRLRPYLPPGCEAVLPTEAQWEYACRAGTQTAFHFGDSITSQQVNFDGDDDFGKAQGAGQTMRVKSLPPNVWGLHEMHGNVWEWCADAMRDYAQASVVDPQGPADSGPAPRALRGGSWLAFAWIARSAYRRASRRDVRDDYVGFRLSLRSTSPASPEGQAGVHPAPEARGPARRDDGPPPAGGLWDRIVKTVSPSRRSRKKPQP